MKRKSLKRCGNAAPANANTPASVATTAAPSASTKPRKPRKSKGTARGKQSAGLSVEVPDSFAVELLEFIIRTAVAGTNAPCGDASDLAALYEAGIEEVKGLREDCQGADADLLYQDLLMAYKLAALMGRTDFPHPSVCDEQENHPAAQPVVRLDEAAARRLFDDQLDALADISGLERPKGGGQQLKVYFESLDNYADRESDGRCEDFIPIAKSVTALATALGEHGFSDPEEYVALRIKAAESK